MIYSLFIYQRRSGLLQYKINFEDISQGKLDMFGSFFSAIKSFILEMKFKGSADLEAITLGDYLIYIISVPELPSDLGIIADKGDNKKIKKLIPKIIKIIHKHKEIFMDWIADRMIFQILDQPLVELIKSYGNLGNNIKIENEHQKKILKLLWSDAKEKTIEQKENLIIERDFLIRQLKKIINFQKRLKILRKIIQISEALKDHSEFIKYKEKEKNLNQEIENRKKSLDYYLKNIKKELTRIVYTLINKNLKDGDYKQVYLNLFSFGNKLKELAKPEISEKYLKLAKILINKGEVSNDQFSKAIADIMQMDVNIEKYFIEY